MTTPLPLEEHAATESVNPSTSGSPQDSGSPLASGVDQGLEWLAAFGDSLYAYALQRVRCRETAEDLVQETFLAAIRSSAGFESRSAPETWLIGILRHKLADHYRERSRCHSLDQLRLRRSEADDEPDDSDPSQPSCDMQWSDPSKVVHESEFQSVMARCLRDLPDLVRQAFEFRVLDRMDADEVCKVLRISSNNLAARLYRARRSVRSCLNRRWFFELHR